jgi:hypothetical protein
VLVLQMKAMVAVVVELVVDQEAMVVEMAVVLVVVPTVRVEVEGGQDILNTSKLFDILVTRPSKQVLHTMRIVVKEAELIVDP